MDRCEKKIKGLQENRQEGQTWADIMDSNEKRTVEEVVEKSLKDRDSEEKEYQNRRKNIIILKCQNPRRVNQMIGRKKMCRGLWGYAKASARLT